MANFTWEDPKLPNILSDEDLERIAARPNQWARLERPYTAKKSAAAYAYTLRKRLRARRDVGSWIVKYARPDDGRGPYYVYLQLLNTSDIDLAVDGNGDLAGG